MSMMDSPPPGQNGGSGRRPWSSPRQIFRMTTKLTVTGWRFLSRRNAHALVRRDAQMIDDPLKHQSSSIWAGVALALVAVVICAIVGVFSSTGKTKDAKILQVDGGGLWVRLGGNTNDANSGTIHPVLNLASARLIIGSPETPTKVKWSELAKIKRGPLMGIAGAPNDMRGSNDRSSTWSVCDTTSVGAAVPLDPKTGLVTKSLSPVVTTAIGGPLVLSDTVGELPQDQARLVTRGDGDTWIVYRTPAGQAVRALIDMQDSVVTDALGLSASAPVLPVSVGLFNAIPAMAPLAPPLVLGAGSPPTFPEGKDLRIGWVLRGASLSGGETFYAVLRDGVQEVSAPAAQMIRSKYSQKSSSPQEVDPATLASYPKSQQLAVDYFPSRQLKVRAGDADPVTCWSWTRNGDDPSAQTRLIVGRAVPLSDEDRASTVKMVSASRSGGAVASEVFMPRSSGRFVQITGAATDSQNREGFFWVADSGVRYGLDASGNNNSTLAALNLGKPVLAPWVVVSLFAEGPTLSDRDARIVHDGMPQDPVVQAVDKDGAATSGKN